ncbi:lysophospholipid acyltransferase family protein [Coralloluteibacterium thermophilus]|uniref:L-ornithine N(alpha)-acyltransferase n=1 Tax=Coralloluteibacterium thermophilum TaxID=2707049 RepID=A0ABV9NM77_9GAMM
MLKLEQRLQARYPHWFQGRRARVARPLLRTLGRWSRFDALDAFLATSTHLSGFAFVEAALEFLQADYRIDAEDLARIPASGRLLIVANHPSGALDALALLHAVGRVRRDVRIVANDVLSVLDNLSELLLPVRILGGRPAPGSLRAIEAALENEGCVIVFPAGEVARLGWRGVTDGRWRRGFLRFAQGTGAPVLPIRIAARNSALFYGASTLYRPAGTALLAREMFARRGKPIALHVGEPCSVPAGVEAAQALRTLRRALDRTGRAPRRSVAAPQPLAPEVPAGQVAAAVAPLTLLGRTHDGKEIRLGRLAMDSVLLHEIGRLRELTFRAVGEGTGRPRDIDAYDAWYEHIVLWDAQAARIAGAYRIARGAEVLARKGLPGFYTASLFDYADSMIPRIAAGMELGRSFVVPDYWGSRSIDYLWQGIGAYLVRNPGVRYLFGPVSMSAATPVDAREQIVAYYARFHGDAAPRARARRPFVFRGAAPAFDALDAQAAFALLRENLAAQGATLPMLYRQYTELCEPGGARFLAFGVDPDFCDSVDGLIEVDLERLRPAKRARYLGSAGDGTHAGCDEARAAPVPADARPAVPLQRGDAPEIGSCAADAAARRSPPPTLPGHPADSTEATA